MEYCPCQNSGHFCMDCERELIAEMRQKEFERELNELEQLLVLLEKHPTLLKDQAEIYVRNKIKDCLKEKGNEKG